MNTKQLVTNASLVAIYVVLSLLTLNVPAFPAIKLTFESFPIFVGALLFGPVDGMMIGGLGAFISQMMTYGLSATTVLWILPPIVRGLMVGLYAKKHAYTLSFQQTALIVLVSCLVVTTLNTLVLWADASIMGYPVSLTVGVIALRFVNSLVMTVVYSLVVPQTVKLLRRTGVTGKGVGA